MAVLMRYRLGIPFIVTASVLVMSPFGGLLSQAIATTRPRIAATTASSGRELEAAIGLFERFNPDLLNPNEPIEVRGRQIEPAFTPLRYSHNEGALTTGLTGSLALGGITELNMSLEPSDGRTPDLSLPASHDTERLIDSTALVEGDIQRQTDVLIRPTPLGFSIYVQLRSVAAPERLTIESNIVCEPTGPELIRRLGAGTFAIEELPNFENECGLFSRARIPAQVPFAPSDSTANYRHELRLLNVARRFAHRDKGTVLAVLSATAARDVTGRVVPTSLAWRGENPVLRVYHRQARYRYPIVARLDFITPAR